jgi:hypothetical protein
MLIKELFYYQNIKKKNMRKNNFDEKTIYRI